MDPRRDLAATDHGFAADDLVQKSQQLETILQASPDGIVAVDGADRITLCNGRSAALFGITENECTGRLMADFISDDLRDTYRQACVTVRISGAPHTIETEICDNNGNPIPVEISIGLKRDHDQPAGYCLVVRNLTALHQIEDNLRESEAQFRRIINALPQFVAYVNPDMTYRYVNNAAQSFFGLPPEQLIGRKSIDIIGARAFEALIPDIEKVLSGTPAHYQRDLIYPDNRIHTIDGQLIPDISAAGTVRGYYAILYDITHLRRTHDALRRSEKKMRSIFHVAPIGIGLSVNRVIAEVNDRLCSMLGYTQEDLIGESTRKIHISEEDFVRTGELRRQHIRQQGRSSMEMAMRRKDGSKVDILVNATPITPGDVDAGIIFTVLDITERKAAEQLVRSQSATMDAIFNSTPSVLMLVDDRGCVEKINRRGSELFGAVEDEARGQPCGLFFKCVNALTSGQCGVGPDCATCPVRSRFSATFRTGTSYWEEEGTMTLRRDGVDIVHHLLISTVLLDLEGTKKVLVAITDISEIKRKEAELTRQRLAHHQLEQQYRQAQKMEPVGRLAGGIAHDLNNLLAPILGYSELLTEELSDHDPRRASVDQILAAGQRARDLIRQLLAFSRKQTLTITDLDLNGLITGFYKLLRRTIREDIGIILHLADDLPCVKGDAGQLEQVILNLAVNAQDAMPSGGELSFTTEPVTLDEAATSGNDLPGAGHYIRLSIRDTGYGMDRETCARVFEPFFTTKDQQRGTGLGLSTVYGIISQHNGAITADSEPGIGTAFIIHLPAGGPAHLVAIKPEKQPLSEARRGSETILLAEDDRHLRAMIEDLLTDMGYTVLSAENGTAALALANDYPDGIQLLLSDVIMPELNGRELYEKLAVRHPKIKPLFMSGYPDDVFANHSVSAETFAFVQKPFALSDLLAEIRRLLEQADG